MRWSLILSTVINVQFALSLIANGLVDPEPLQYSDSVGVVRRSPAGPKASSKTYRKNAEDHKYAYKFDNLEGVTREKLHHDIRKAYGGEVLKIPKTDAGTVPQNSCHSQHLNDFA